MRGSSAGDPFAIFIIKRFLLPCNGEFLRWIDFEPFSLHERNEGCSLWKKCFLQIPRISAPASDFEKILDDFRPNIRIKKWFVNLILIMKMLRLVHCFLCSESEAVKMKCFAHISGKLQFPFFLELQEKATFKDLREFHQIYLVTRYLLCSKFQLSFKILMRT